LTKEPTRYSRWTFDKVGGIDVMVGYVRNENDKGKDAWLGFGATINRFSKGEELHEPVLSFEHKTKLAVGNALDGR